MTAVKMPIIGYMKSPYREKFGIPRQPNLVQVESYIEMVEPQGNYDEFINTLAYAGNLPDVFLVNSVANTVAANYAMDITLFAEADEEWENAGVKSPKEIKEKLTFIYSIERRNIEGGTGSKSLQGQFEKAEAFLNSL